MILVMNIILEIDISSMVYSSNPYASTTKTPREPGLYRKGISLKYAFQVRLVKYTFPETNEHIALENQCLDDEILEWPNMINMDGANSGTSGSVSSPSR